MSGLTAVVFFLTSLVFSLLIFSLWVRIALRYVRMSALSPFSRLISTITDPLIKPLTFLFKRKYTPGQRYDKLAFIMLVLVELIKIICFSLLVLHTLMPLFFIVVYVLADLIIQPCNLLFYAILTRVIMSYVNPYWQHPVADFLRLVTEPLLIWARKIIPDIAGFDFSPLILMVLLKIITLFITASLPLNIL